MTILRSLNRPLANSSVFFSSSRLLSSLAVLDANAPSYNVLSAAGKLGAPVTVLLAGTKAAVVAEQAAKFAGVEKVITASSDAYDHALAENYAPLIVENVIAGKFTHVFAPASAFGKNVLPRAAALLDSQQISDIIDIKSEDTFVRPIYAGNVILTLQSSDPVKLITVRSSAFPEPAESGSSTAAPIEPAADPASPSLATFVSEELTKSERPELTSAKKVVSGGRGLKDKENFDKLIFPLADALGAAVGASRAAVDSGFADNSLQVGQTGKVVAPELYIAVGISGAIQHLAGMKDSKTIAAINKGEFIFLLKDSLLILSDPDAPIFEIADAGLVADLFEAVPELTEKLK
ncbi:electron transfer flavoprotein domain-containing protein [Lipomyces oligophaga]|uniref:electron transfer flavoprotein domain-containing protein n=1 Tax=Lipomyces oligophaga TaxID=45792 RepID=UPI0034CD1909